MVWLPGKSQPSEVAKWTQPWFYYELKFHIFSFKIIKAEFVRGEKIFPVIYRGFHLFYILWNLLKERIIKVTVL